MTSGAASGWAGRTAGAAGTLVACLMTVTPQHAVEESTPPKPALLARVIGRSRLIVMVAVVAVLATAFSLFLLGARLAAKGIWNA